MRKGIAALLLLLVVFRGAGEDVLDEPAGGATRLYRGALGLLW